MNREELSAICARCGQLAEGYAFIGDDRYCHPDDGVDCYTLASHELTSSANQAFIEKAQAPADEEREDMIAWLMRDHGDDLSPLGRDYTDAEIADMLRRPAQTEPTEAQVVAAYRAHIEARMGRVLSDMEFEATRSGVEITWMRAALRAAFFTGQEDKP